MKCRPCDMEMTATVEGAETRVECPECHRAVMLRDVGVASGIVPEPARPPRPVFSLEELLEADDTAAILTPEQKAAQSAAMREGKTASGKAKGTKACEWCGTQFVPFSANARFCQTKDPLCRDEAYAATIRKTAPRDAQSPEFQAANA